MKHSGFHRAIVAIAMMLIGWLPSLAHDFVVDGIFYDKLNSSKVAVTYDSSYSDEYVGNVVIPSSVNYNGVTYSVTSIGDRAFYRCTSLTSIQIPNSVTRIGSSAFSGCSSLTSIEIPNSVTSIGDYAFYNCESLTSIEIPNSVTSIGDYAFYCCSSLTSVVVDSGNTKYDSRNDCNAIIETASNTLIAGCQNTIIPNSVTSIGDYAFAWCESLTSIQIPNSVTSIGDEAFYLCRSLTSIEIPNSVTSIGVSAFDSCERLTSVVIGNSVTSIGYRAFYECSGLTSIEIPNSVTSIGSSAFSHCSSLTSIQIPNSVTSIGYSAFYDCSSLTSVVIGNSVTSIGDEAFYYCESLTSVIIGNSVTSIGEYAFSNCISLTSIEIPNSVTSIGYAAFSDCESLTSIQIGNSVTSIGEGAFYYCSSLTSIEIPNSVTSIGYEAFYYCTSLTSIAVDAGNSKYDSRNGCNAIIETASNTLITGCQNTIIPNSVTSIGDDAFAYCSNLTSIEIPNSVTSIGDDAFYRCENLTSIQIPNSVTSIGYHAFSDCESLTSVVWNAKKCSDFSSSSRPFYNSPNITSFTFGDEVEHIPAYLCYNLSSLTSIVWNAKKCSDFSSSSRPFENSPNITSFTFGDEVEHIPAYLCYNLSSLTSIEIPDSVTSIGSWAFHGCENLTSIQIPNSVTSIGDGAFWNCTSLTSIQIPNSVTSIGGSAFEGCENLTSVVWNVKKCSDFSSSSRPFENSPNITSFTFGDEVEHIPAYLCYNLSSLTSIEIPNSVTSVGDGAFWNCTSLTSIQIPNSVTSIGGSAFEGCKSLTSIEIPNSVTSIGGSAFEGCENLTSVVWNVKKCSDFSSSSRPFENSPNITSFTFGDEVEHIPAYLCYNLSSLTSIEIPNSVTSVGDGAFWNCTSLTSIQIPNSVTSIGGSAFEGCKSLTSVVWNVKKCSDFSSSSRPFENSPNITSFTFGDEVEHIPAYLCYRMENLTNIEIPNSVISIGESAFSNGERLTIVVLGNSLTSIEKDAFKGCDNIKKIESKATKAPTIENEDQFSENVYANADLFVPIGYEDNYKYAYAWSEFHNIKGKDFSVKATSISLDKNEVSLKPTQTVVLTETIQPYDTSNKKVTWSSSDDNIAKVDTNGLVIAIAVGEATITATTTDGSNLSATCKVTVVPTLAETIILDKTEISLEATESATLIATVLPEATFNKDVEWSSSDETVAVVDENGVVTAIAVGEATITATTTDGSNLSATCKVTVVPTLAVSIELDQTEANVEEKSDLQLTANILPEHTTNKEVAWSSSKKVIATVDDTGLVFVKSVGEVVITATTTDGSNLSATCRINVYSGIDGVNGDDVIVATVGDNIVVKNAKIDSIVRVYASNGASIASEIATNGYVVIKAPIKGVYIVSVNGKTFKVMVK